MTNFSLTPRAVQDELRKIALALVQPKKGIFAADETLTMMGKKLLQDNRDKDLDIDNTPENRRIYRQLLFSTNKVISQYVSGVIVFSESLYQTADDGTRFVDKIRLNGLMPGIKADSGIVRLYGTEDEYTTQGLDDLGVRCAQFKKDGCHFAKWRCVLKIGMRTPSHQAIMENANVLARYAAICQANRLVPIVEPEILQDGEHPIDQTQKVTETVLSAVFKALIDQNVFLEGTVLKSAMILAGKQCPKKSTPEEIAEATVTTFQRTVPTAVAGIAFLSGGQSEEQATVNLNAINKYVGRKPWPLTFAFGRALQASVLKTWKGRSENVSAAQKEFLKRVQANGEATIGKYVAGSVIGSASTEDLFSENYTY